MRSGCRVTVLATVVLVLAPVLPVAAQPDAGPSGHWEGTLQAPGKAVTFELDLARNARGELAGTFGNPAQGEKGIPLAMVAVVGHDVRFAVKATAGGGTFRATLDRDGRTMAGDFELAGGGGTFPFRLVRTGAARISPPPRSPAIAKQLEGSWSGALAVEGKQVAIRLAMANQPDGTSTGTISTDGLQLPIAIRQDASQLRIEVPSVGGSYVGTLNAAGTQLVGTWSQRSRSLPLTFARDAR